MDQHDDIPATTAGVRPALHWKSGLAVVLCSASAVTLAGWMAPDATSRVVAVVYATFPAVLVCCLWWLFFSGVSWLQRLVVPVVVCILLIGVTVGCVKRLYFDGDMRPRFLLRWEKDPRQEAARWLSENGNRRLEISEEDVPFQITEADWPRYCGFESQRVISEPAPENPDWGASPPREIWRHPVGQAWSSFAVVGQRLFTQEQRGEQECVVCYNADTGEQIWLHSDTAKYKTPLGGVGPRATPTLSVDGLYSLGATGILNCLQPTTGEPIWQRNICVDAGSDMLEWGMSGSPLLVDDVLIVDAGGTNDSAVIAYNRLTGDILWQTGNHKAGYAAPRIETINGEVQLLIFHGDGLQSLVPGSGELRWEFPWTNGYKINVAQPMRFGDQLFISSGYDAGCVMLDPTQLDRGQPAEVWERNKSIKLKFNEAVKSGGFVYGLDDGILCCVDALTGERRWKGGRYRFGQVLLWGDKLLIQAENGDVALVEATPGSFVEITRFQALTDRTWNVPVVCNGRLYVRNADEAACFDLRPSRP